MKSNLNPIPENTKTLHDILPKNISESRQQSKVLEMEKIDKELEKLNNVKYQEDDEDDRDQTIEKLKEVNEILRNKVKDLESVVEQTIEKTINQEK